MFLFLYKIKLKGRKLFNLYEYKFLILDILDYIYSKVNKIFSVYW